jgi:uncharacterized membrane protein
MVSASGLTFFLIVLNVHDSIFIQSDCSGDTSDGVAFCAEFFDHRVLLGAFFVVGFKGAVEVAGLAVEFLASVFGATVFAEVRALAASAGKGDHGLSISV